MPNSSIQLNAAQIAPRSPRADVLRVHCPERLADRRHPAAHFKAGQQHGYGRSQHQDALEQVGVYARDDTAGDRIKRQHAQTDRKRGDEVDSEHGLEYRTDRQDLRAQVAEYSENQGDAHRERWRTASVASSDRSGQGQYVAHFDQQAQSLPGQHEGHRQAERRHENHPQRTGSGFVHQARPAHEPESAHHARDRGHHHDDRADRLARKEEVGGR